MNPSGQLKRQLGFTGAGVLGLGSIMGTGVFVALGLGAGLVGPGVIVALFAGGILATVNGLNSAQLAAAHPRSGGTYEYGYEFLAPPFGFAAGALFLFAKSASAATATLGLGGYLYAYLAGSGIFSAPPAAPSILPLILSAGFLFGLGGVALGGVKPALRLTGLLVGSALLCIALFVTATMPVAVARSSEHFTPFFQSGGAALSGFEILAGLGEATALMFVAYTGYGRIATLGEEVREPERTIPRAVIATLALSFAVYCIVAFSAVGAMGGTALYQSTLAGAAPLEQVAEAVAPGWPAAVIAAGALLALAGVLLNLILGLSRIVLAMARRGDLPAFLGHVNAAGSSPVPAVLAVMAAIGLLLLTGDVRFTWSFSAFFVLLYYAITNLCALRLPDDRRLYPRWLAGAGLAACALLAFQIEWRAWLPGLAVLLALLGIFLIRRRRQINA